MECKRVFYVPDYYKSFFCKGGDCRATCCHGWDITLTMEEYFRLLGLECSPELRRRIDGAFYLEDRPTPERYAVFARSWDGGCPLHNEDGYCALQRELGEEVLPAPCRYYPRHPIGNECSVSNGCEQLCEMLFKHEDAIKFERRELTFKLPSLPKKPENAEREALRFSCIDIMQSEELTIAERFAALFKMLSPDGTASFEFNLSMLKTLSDDIALHSPCMCGYCERADEAYAENADQRYNEGIARFETLFASHEHMITMLLVNRMFYSGFPYSESGESSLDSAISLSAVYALIKYFAAVLPENATLEDFADLCAALFRHIDNTAFDLRTAALLHRECVRV